LFTQVQPASELPGCGNEAPSESTEKVDWSPQSAFWPPGLKIHCKWNWGELIESPGILTILITWLFMTTRIDIWALFCGAFPDFCICARVPGRIWETDHKMWFQPVTIPRP